MKIACVCGARPNFVKIAPIIHELRKCPEIQPIIVHTGQHYDERMSKLFFDQLEIPRPDINLEVGSGSHAAQTAEIMMGFEQVCLQHKPTHTLLVGDVNSTVACALVAVKSGVTVIHVEAGLRSFDRSMPEEINRILTDQISDCLFVTEESAMKNLRNEGVAAEKVHMVGNVMVDTLLRFRAKAEESPILEKLGLHSGGGEGGGTGYAVLTLHRPSNVDDPAKFRDIMDAMLDVARQVPIIFSVHPRTLKRIQDGSWEKGINVFAEAGDWRTAGRGGLTCLPPLGYLDFLKLTAHARLVVTDSGGIQEETTVLHVPCITIRENTERPVTITHGTNRLVGTDPVKIVEGCRKAMSDGTAKSSVPPLWDGHAAERIVAVLRSSGKVGASASGCER